MTSKRLGLSGCADGSYFRIVATNSDDIEATVSTPYEEKEQTFSKWETAEQWITKIIQESNNEVDRDR